MMRVFRPSVATAVCLHGVHVPRDDWHATGSSPRLFTLPVPTAHTHEPLAPAGSIALLLTVAGDALHARMADTLAATSASARQVLDARRKDGRASSARTPFPAHVAELLYAGEPWMTGLVLDADAGFTWCVQDFPGAALEAGRFSLRPHSAEAGFALEASVLLTPPALNDIEALAQQEFPPVAPTARQPWLRPGQGG
ncbi:hypothetical protein EJ065_5482 [Corallococcus coralloides]|uniref:Uncharacterized protein n=1 Tax=Corallococcus coralloides TaxID=184914 RepID=A0A410RYU4_CORCK|nr:hypothetical protein [Corallococcus coralloides]QAT87016.1 hypothetical protein EJ065_5482 [Corallococcus coralloides]